MSLSPAEDCTGFEPEQSSYRIPLGRLDDALAAIEKANRRLEREGIDERFIPEVTEHRIARPPRPEEIERFGLQPGSMIDASYAEIALSKPVINHDGWHFEAALDRLPGTDSFTIRTAGSEFGGWQPEPGVCDHCQQKRQRNTTFLVAHDDGRQLQVGSTCVESFLGVKPKGLWSMQFDLSELKEGADEDLGFGPGGPEPVTDNRQLIAEVLAVSDGGKSFVSRSAAEFSDRQATIDELVSLQAAHGGKDYADFAERAEAFDKDGTVDAVIAAARQLPRDSDYGQNMHTVLDTGFTGRRTRALLSSAVAVWHRQQQQKAAPEPPAAGHLAPVKERVRDVPATVTRVRYHHSNFGYHERLTTIVTMRAKDGHEVVWFASNDPEVSEGDEVSMTATVKKHDSYRGVDQTVVTRATLTPAANPS